MIKKIANIIKAISSIAGGILVITKFNRKFNKRINRRLTRSSRKKDRLLSVTRESLILANITGLNLLYCLQRNPSKKRLAKYTAIKSLPKMFRR